MPWWFLLIGAVVILFGFVVFRGAPYLPTHKKQVELALDLLQLPAGATVVDLGSGDGVFLKAAAQRGLVAHGYELNPLLCIISYLRCWRYRRLVRVHWGDFWRQKLPTQTAGAFTFLAAPYMNHFGRRIGEWRAELGHDFTVVSYGFEIPGREVKTSQSGLNLYEITQP